MVGGRFVVSNNVVLVDSRRRVPARTLCDSTCHCGGPSTRTGTSCAGSKQFDSHLASVARDWRRRRLLEPTVRDAHHLNDARQALDSCRRRHHSRQLCMAEITRITITAVVCCLLDTQRFAVGRGRDMLSCLTQLVFGDERLVLSAWASLATAQAGREADPFVHNPLLPGRTTRHSAGVGIGFVTIGTVVGIVLFLLLLPRPAQEARWTKASTSAVLIEPPEPPPPRGALSLPRGGGCRRRRQHRDCRRCCQSCATSLAYCPATRCPRHGLGASSVACDVGRSCRRPRSQRMTQGPSHRPHVPK